MLQLSHIVSLASSFVDLLLVENQRHRQLGMTVSTWPMCELLISV